MNTTPLFTAPNERTLMSIVDNLDQLNSTIEDGLAKIDAIHRASNAGLTFDEIAAYDDLLTATMTCNKSQKNICKMLELLINMKDAYTNRN